MEIAPTLAAAAPPTAAAAPAVPSQGLAAQADTNSAAPPDARYAALDDPEVQAGFTRPAARGADGACRQAFLSIDGMHCAACAVAIESGLRALPAVRAVRVNVAAGSAVLDWDSAAMPLSRAFAAVEAAGYRAYPAGDQAARAAGERERRAALWRLGVAGLCMMQVMMYAWPAYVSGEGELPADVARLLQWAGWMMSLPVVLWSAWPFYASAWADCRRGRVGMDLPVAIGVVVTFVASTWSMATGHGEVYFDSLAMFVFFLLGGRWLEMAGRRRAAVDLERITRRLPESVERLDGWPAAAPGVRVAAHRVAPGDVVRVAVGEAFPGDARVLAGESSADESVLTGESRPQPKRAGDAVVAGSFNLTGPLVVRIERTGADSRFGQVLALVERAAAEKPRLAVTADRYARWFLVGVLALAAAAGLGWWWAGSPRAVWIAVSVLIVTCPCALSLAAPVASLAALGRLARAGVLVTHPQAIETLAGVTHAVFDKTGTLTCEVPALRTVEPLREGVDPARALALAGALEAGSRHPLARALVAAAAEHGSDAAGLAFERIAEHPGQGVEGDFDGMRWRLGAPPEPAPGDGAPAPDAGPPGPVAELSDAHGPVARFRFDDGLREDAAEALAGLAAQGVSLSLLSGDRPGAVAAVARRAGIERAVALATPAHKLAHVQALQASGVRLLMVGDGINDAPVLSRADVSVAMGQGAPIAQSGADMVLLTDRLAALPFARALAARTLRVTRQNLAWAAGYNAVCVPVALAGYLPPWLAGLGMAASSLAVVANALRLAR